MNAKALLSSNKDEWATPEAVFRALDDEFHFTLDPCATEENHKCEKFFTREQDGLKQEWGGCVFCNPPYGKKIGRWVKKARESAECGTTCVLLIPARTDTRWFHDEILGRAEIRFIRGRLRFEGAEHNAPFPSMIVIFKGRER